MISDLSHWFSNGQKWGGLKKLLSMSIMKVWQLTLILTKQDSLGRGHIEKWAFLHSSDEKTWFLTFPLVFKWSNMGFKKASLYVYFEGLTTNSYSAKQDSLGRDHIEKRLFYTLLMRKHDFWPFHWFSNGQKLGVKKASLYVYFEGLTTDSYFGKTRLPGERSYREKAFLHSSDEKTWFLTFPLIFKWSKMGG